MLDEPQFDIIGGLEAREEVLEDLFESFGVLIGETDGFREEPVTDSIERGTLFSFGRNGAAGLGTVDAGRFRLIEDIAEYRQSYLLSDSEEDWKAGGCLYARVPSDSNLRLQVVRGGGQFG